MTYAVKREKQISIIECKTKIFGGFLERTGINKRDRNRMGIKREVRTGVRKMIFESRAFTTLIGVMIPFLGTTLGASMVFFMKNEFKINLQRFLLGFASGVMIAASVWSLLIPAIDQSASYGKAAWVPAAVGFLVGITFFLLLDKITPYLRAKAKQAEGITKKIKRESMLFLAVTLHNIPEGMAVGVVFAGMLSKRAEISAAAAMALSVGISIQNFPEGAIVSMPIKAETGSKRQAFWYGFASGIVEPAAAGFTLLLTAVVVPVLPYLLAFAAGAMIYVVVEELIPDFQKNKNSDIGMIGVAIGFALMMILDVALG